ncbi:MAG: choice-of-anchor I family protein, partial [Flavobacteriaceae bacterium]
MKRNTFVVIAAVLGSVVSCDTLDDFIGNPGDNGDKEVNFNYRSTIQVGGEGASEISAFCSKTHKLFVVNVEINEISVFDISDVDAPQKLNSITLDGGAPNSVAVSQGKLAVAIEGTVKQDPGTIAVYNTADHSWLGSYPTGALPDMVTFSPNGNYIVSANEGEPNDDYTVDPRGSVTIVTLSNGNISTLYFDAFNGDEAILENQGFRVFGPNANLAMDVEPEYIAISDDSQTAWVALQENNGLAKVDLTTKRITDIYPLGFKDYGEVGNGIDPSNKDDKTVLRNVPVFGMYQPDGITYLEVGGIGYVVSANEGDSREYEGTPGYVGEERIKDIVLDPTAFPDADELQENGNLGRLKIALSEGDPDGDGDYDRLYSYGARSFSIWSGNGQLVYDSGN